MRRTAALLASLALITTACSSDPASDVVDDAPATSTADDGARDEGDLTTDENDPAAEDDTGGDAEGGADAPDPAASSADTEQEPAPTATTGGSEPTTSGGDGTQTAGSDADVDAPSPVPAGTYRYATDGETQLGANDPKPMPEQTSLVVGPVDGNDVQVQTRDTRDEDGYGSQNALTYQFSENGVVLLAGELSSTVEVFGSPLTSQYELEAAPPAVVGPINPQPGDVSKVHLEGDGIEVDATITLLRREDITIGGVTVNALVVDAEYDISGDLEGRSEATWWLRPDDLLLLREESMTEATQQGVTYREEHVSVLQSLDAA